MSDLETQFNAIDKLLGLTPFFKCPKCGKRDEDGKGTDTYFNLEVEVNFTVDVNDARKTFEARLSDITIPDDQFPPYPKIFCSNCGDEVGFPEGWKWEVT